MKVIDRSGRILVMRPDNTTPIARLTAAKLRGQPLPQRLYYNQSVYRSDDAHTGRSAATAQCGVELIDFKLEFGRADGELLLCDEISPDSCRLWEKGTDKKLDKDRFRRDLGDVLGGYREVLERLEK